VEEWLLLEYPMPEGEILRHPLKNYRSINILKDERKVSLSGSYEKM
jgi:hypothetical protein